MRERVLRGLLSIFTIHRDMATNGVFPLIRKETHTTIGATTWGDDTTKEVGVIKIAGAHTTDFDSTNFPGNPGDMVIVVNTTASNVNVLISPDPFGDDTADGLVLGAGAAVSVIYHEDNGWLFMGTVAAS